MESEHYTPVDVRHTQAVACLTINSRYTAGGRGRIVYDALVDQIFTARRYMLRIRARLHNFFLTRDISETA